MSTKTLLEQAGDTIENRVGDLIDAARDVVRDEPAPGRSGGTLVKVLVLGAAVGIGGLIFSKVKAARAQSAAWQDAQNPTPSEPKD